MHERSIFRAHGLRLPHPALRHWVLLDENMPSSVQIPAPLVWPNILDVHAVVYWNIHGDPQLWIAPGRASVLYLGAFLHVHRMGGCQFPPDVHGEASYG